MQPRGARRRTHAVGSRVQVLNALAGISLLVILMVDVFVPRGRPGPVTKRLYRHLSGLSTRLSGRRRSPRLRAAVSRRTS